MNIDLFMLNGTVAMAVPAAEAKTEDTKNETTTGEMTGSSATPETSGNTEGEAGGAATADTNTDISGGEANDMAGGDTANMAGDGMAGDGMAGMNGMDGMNTEVGTAKPITQNAPVMIGITAGVLALSILVGIGLAKLKIKKGINLYED